VKLEIGTDVLLPGVSVDDGFHEGGLYDEGFHVCFIFFKISFIFLCKRYLLLGEVFVMCLVWGVYIIWAQNMASNQEDLAILDETSVDGNKKGIDVDSKTDMVL